jgi:hypothetical protein
MNDAQEAVAAAIENLQSLEKYSAPRFLLISDSNEGKSCEVAFFGSEADFAAYLQALIENVSNFGDVARAVLDKMGY